MDTNRIQVEILGETFSVKGGAAREEIEKTSAFLREQIDVLKSRSPALSTKNLAILTAFSMADELRKLRIDYEALASLLDNA